MAQQRELDTAQISVRNVGGIDECEVEFAPGTTVLSGRNATNRTSLLRAISGALGGTAGTLKTDADEGEVELMIGGSTYTRQYERTANGVTVDGDPYTDENELIDLFACLLEDNPARRAIERGDSLREIIMRPVDTEAIQRTIGKLEDERSEINARIKEIRSELDRAPALERKRDRLREELDAVDEELEAVRASIDDHEVDPEDADAAEEAFEELSRLRHDLDRKQSQANTLEETIEALREEKTDIESELDAHNDRSDELDEITEKLNRLQGRERTLADVINDLSGLVDLNEDILDDDGLDLDVVLPEDRSVTAELDPESAVVRCWTCGSEVEQSAIDDRMDELREVIDEKRTERQELRSKIEALRERQRALKESEYSVDDLRRERRETESEIERRQRQLERVREEVEELRSAVGDQEHRVRETEEFRNSELLDQYERLSELEYERGQLETELEEVTEDLDQLDELAGEREQLEAQRDELQEELAAQRTRIEDLEREAVKSFNEQMDEILDLLEYGNIERVWIERKEGTDFDSRHGGYRGGSVTTFDLHVVRASDNGAVYEDTVNTLSESEREVIGLVVALAGYLVHQVHDLVPMMLLDSLEAIDADRIGVLLEYFAEYADFLVVALLPEDAQAQDGWFDEISASVI